MGRRGVLADGTLTGGGTRSLLPRRWSVYCSTSSPAHWSPPLMSRSSNPSCGLEYKLEPTSETKGLRPEEPQKSHVTPPTADPAGWLGLKPPCSLSKPPPSPAMLHALAGRKQEDTAGSSGGEMRSVDGTVENELGGGQCAVREGGELGGGQCAVQEG